MKAILCKITEVQSFHPDYRVVTDYSNGEHEPVSIGVPGDLKYLNALSRYSRNKENNSQSFCAPGFIRVGDPVLRFDWLPEQYLRQYNFDHYSVFGENYDSNSKLFYLGGNTCPLRSQVVPAKLIWGESQVIRCLQTRDHIRTDLFGHDYSKALGFCQFSPPGEYDDSGESNRIF